MTFLYVLSIFIFVWQTILCTGLLIYRARVPRNNILLLAASITALISHGLGYW